MKSVLLMLWLRKLLRVNLLNVRAVFRLKLKSGERGAMRSLNIALNSSRERLTCNGERITSTFFRCVKSRRAEPGWAANVCADSARSA